MRVPKSLTISGRRWTVVRGDPGEGVEGTCEHATRTIVLSDALEGEDLERVFWHELGHALLPEAQIILSEKHEELIVELFSQRIGGVVKQLFGRTRKP